jgi:hypothetical protein
MGRHQSKFGDQTSDQKAAVARLTSSVRPLLGQIATRAELAIELAGILDAVLDRRHSSRPRWDRPWWPLMGAAMSGGHCNASASLSGGVIQSRVCRGLVGGEIGAFRELLA